MTPGTRVTKLDSRGIPTSQRGTVKEALDTREISLIEWDGGQQSIESNSTVIPHHQLKAMVKHGPKIRKR